MTESFKRDVNRFQKVPTINENGFLLSESLAIFHYLGRRGIIPERWYPKKDLKAVIRIDECLQWQHTNLINGAGTLFYIQWVLPLKTGEKPSRNEIENQIRILSKNLDDLENDWLKHNKFLTGSEVTFADLMAACMLEQVIGLKLFKIDKKRHALVAVWIEEIRTYFGEHFQEAHHFIYLYGERVIVNT